MKAILDDLSMDDYFNIIDFNHNVRCWSDDLVQASSIQVDDAKRYIQRIKPSGGEKDFPLDFLFYFTAYNFKTCNPKIWDDLPFFSLS